MVFKNAKMFSLFPKCISFWLFFTKKNENFLFLFLLSTTIKKGASCDKNEQKIISTQSFLEPPAPKMSQKIHFFKRRKILLWSAKFTTELPFQNVKFTRTHTMEV